MTVVKRWGGVVEMIWVKLSDISRAAPQRPQHVLSVVDRRGEDEVEE